MLWGADQWATVAIALVIGLAAVGVKLRDQMAGRGDGAGGSRAGRAAVGSDPRRGSPLFDQDAEARR